MLLPVLLAGAAFGVGAPLPLLALMLFLTGLGVTYMDATEGRPTTIVNNHMAKIDLATRSGITTRANALSTFRKMILFTDPFERDEQWLQFNNRAGEFAAARGQLLALPLTPEERELLDRQGRLTGVAVPLQGPRRRAVLTGQNPRGPVAAGRTGHSGAGCGARSTCPALYAAKARS